MDYFEEKEKEKKEKQVFEEGFKRQLKIFRIAFCTSFFLVGAIFLIVGLVMLNVERQVSYILIPMGVFFLIVATLACIITLSVKPDFFYERYKKSYKEARPIMNTSQYSMRILMLEAKVKELEKEIENLKSNR